MKNIKIGNREIGAGYDPLIIAEIGINHGGDLQVAFEMVDAAAAAGAEVIKHQTHIVEDEYSAVAKHVVPGNSDLSIYEIMEGSALNEKEELRLKEYIEAKGMIFMSSPFSRAAVDRLERFGVQAYKIGSGEMNNYPLLKYIASKGKTMVVSTGMNDLESVNKAVKILEESKVDYALLHTTNIYPTPPELVRLGGMQDLMKEYPDVVVGLSDHTLNNNASNAAIALGAKIIERHFTDSMYRKGPDIINSMDPASLKELLISSKEITKMLGGNKEAAKEEQVTIDFAFASVVTIKPISKGEIFSEDNLWVKRPGTGEISAEHFETILGKRANRNIENDAQLTWDTIE